MVVQFSGVSIAGIKTSPPEKRIVLLPWPPRECRGNIWILHLQHLNVNSRDRAAAPINAGLELPLPDHRSNSRPRDVFRRGRASGPAAAERLAHLKGLSHI